MFLSVKVKNLCPRVSLREVLVLESLKFRNFYQNAPWSNNLNQTQEDIFEELLCDHRDVSFKNDVVKDNFASSCGAWHHGETLRVARASRTREIIEAPSS